MENKEPVIIANNLSENELHEWMSAKIRAINELKLLNEEKASLELRLIALKSQIRSVSQQSCIAVFQQTRGSIPHP
ncbi:Uncharacterised protein [Serratia odorifera]|uniref:Uncharacterized protein n=1 Tax=Serratia odorifera TaxID=618 RepID=A0A447KKI8_SEROD|nr:Uncharacterised protein [Serratia odorifera]